VPVSVAAKPLLQNVVQQVQNAQRVQVFQQDHDVQLAPHSQQISITTESTRYAQTRYPFPPFIIRFNAGKVTCNQIKEGLTTFCNQNYQMEINRLSNRSCNNEYLKRCIFFFLSIRSKPLAYYFWE
jgi:hypothetical protein